MKPMPRTLPVLLSAALAGSLSFATLLTAAHARQAGNDSTYSWTYQYKKGTTVRLRGRMAITGEIKQEVNGKTETTPINVEIRSLNKQEVKSVAANGDANVQDTTEQYEIRIDNNPPNPHDKPQPVTRTISKTGQILKQQVAREDAQAQNAQVEALSFILSEMIAPDKPIKIGETWKSELNNRFVEGQKVTQTSTLVSAEKIAGVDALKVKVQMSVPTKVNADEKYTLKLDGAYYVDPKDGRKIRADFDLENLPLSTQAGELIVKASYHVAQIIPGFNDKEDTADKGK
ncbi:MAG TPA: hypothetical protein VKU00_34250 [Chthonomonadaceae bacterium]|nr:hypothetical protein [Chthonomonadaceae bacterium]